MKRFCLIMALALLLCQVLAPSAAAAAKQRCFSHENSAIVNCISGAFKTYWEANGGLPIFGYPISKVTTEKSATGEIQVQWFERARLEQHPESQPPYNVQLTLLGEKLLAGQGRDWRAGSQGQHPTGCRLFVETGHTLCEPFLSYYRSHGLQFDKQATTFSEPESLALFGLPLTEPVLEPAADGQAYLTQWFQRARFELHPQNPPATRVLLGLLGMQAHSTTALNSGPSAQPSQGQASCDNISAAQNAIVPGACLNDANRYRTAFSLKDYKPGEVLGAWLVDANDIVVGSQGRAACALNGNSISLGSMARCRSWQVDDYGNASGIELNASDLYPGQWKLVLQSTNRSTSSTIFFQVLPHAPIKNDPCAGRATSVQAIVTPPCGQSGALFKMIGQGFNPGEPISFFITAPDTIVEPMTTSYYMNVAADADGNVTLVAQVPDNALKGSYFITATGVGSGHKAIGVVYKM